MNSRQSRMRLSLFSASVLAGACITGSSLEWEKGYGHSSAPVSVAPGGRPGFTLVDSQITSVSFTNALPESRHLTNQILLNGSGVAAGDIDGDGWCDLYFCRADGTNALYRNLGNWKFAEITELAGVGCANLTSTASTLTDLDGDGDLDLIVNSLGHGTHVFYNDGRGHFVKAPFVLNPGRGGMSMAVGDADGDGFLDLYVANYRTVGLMDIVNARATFKKVGGRTVMDTFNGRPVADDPELRDRFVIGPRGNVEEQGEPDAFFRNLNGTNFSAVSFTEGAFLDENGKPLSKPPFDWGLSVMFRDVNQDGMPDLYVCNDFESEDRFWINQGQGKFKLAPRLALRKLSMFSMGVDFADINRDGFDDFFVVDMLSRSHSQRMREIRESRTTPFVIGQIENRPQSAFNTLFLNRTDGTFAEIAQLSGVHASEWSWSCVFLDVDLDGWEDVLVSNGMERAARDLDVADQMKKLRATRQLSNSEIFQARRAFPRLATSNIAFRNKGDLTFQEAGKEWGFDLTGVSNGIALADLDNDGDLDVVVNNLNAPASLYRNNNSAPRVAVRLKGLPPNSRGVGARITVSGGAVEKQSQEIISGGRYLSSDDTVRSFAAGTATNNLRIEVIWRSGKRSVVESAKPDRIYLIEESSAKISEPRPKTDRVQMALFQDVSNLIGHSHQDEEFDDFARQALLPYKLSQLGSGIVWFDADGDNWDDLIIGSGKGGTLAVYRNNGKGGFNRWQGPGFDKFVTRDLNGLVAWRNSNNERFIMAAQANYEDGLSSGAAARIYDCKAQTVLESILAGESSIGPLAMADFDNDGDLDLFAGGRVKAGKHPSPASSILLRNESGTFAADEINGKIFENVGLVSGAVWSNVDGDGDLDLILACEWGPIRLFLNEKGKLQEETESWGLSKYTGWWNGVTIGDFDADGRIDIAASNWGRNTKYESYREHPLLVYYGDIAGNGNFDVIEAYFDASLQNFVPERQLGVLSKNLPFLREQFQTHQAFSTASVTDILRERLNGVRTNSVVCLESAVFLNRGKQFEYRSLPIEGQFSPAFGISSGDFNGDGMDDLVLAQNFFAVQPETGRYDGGRGLLLLGDGQGSFNSAAPEVSGLKIDGEQRGAAVADYDADGRLDLAVVQNGAATKLYKNVAGKPGLRVRLEGSAQNPDAIGAAVRLIFGDRFGMMREVQAGAGYGSQNSHVLVFGIPEAPTAIEVRWPDGRQTRTPVPANSKEIRVSPTGIVSSPQPSLR